MYLFDMDSCLCPSKQPMDPVFAEKFENWAESHDFAIVTGSPFDYIERQIPVSILEKARYIFANSANSVYMYTATVDPSSLESIHSTILNADFKPKLVHNNEFIDSQALTDYLLFELKYSNWPGKRFGTNFEYRGSALNFSVIGREADQENRDAYESWDILDGERTRICAYINERFTSFTALIGGQISIDIVNRGKDKGQVLDYFDLTSTSFVFFGDKIKSGNDRPLAERISKEECGISIEVTCWQDTMRELGLNPITVETHVEDIPDIEVNPT